MVIGGVGLAVLIVTTILSQFTPHDSDMGFGGDHDAPSFDHDTGTTAQTDVQETGPSPLSLRTISIFFTIFGATATIATHYGASALLATICGVGMGYLFAWFIYRIIKSVYKQQGNSNVHASEYLNLLGRATTMINKQTPGEVYVIYAGQRRDLLAYTRSDVQINTGSQIKITEVNGNTVVVEPVTT